MCACKLSTKLQHSCIFFNSPEAEYMFINNSVSGQSELRIHCATLYKRCVLKSWFVTHELYWFVFTFLSPINEVSVHFFFRNETIVIHNNADGPKSEDMKYPLNRMTSQSDKSSNNKQMWLIGLAFLIFSVTWSHDIVLWRECTRQSRRTQYRWFRDKYGVAQNLNLY